MTNWMAALAAHHARMRRQYPTDELLILFDIDGTILDLTVLHQELTPFDPVDKVLCLAH